MVLSPSFRAGVRFIRRAHQDLVEGEATRIRPCLVLENDRFDDVID
jgi:hypothetical protein